MSDQSSRDIAGVSIQMVATFMAALAYVLQKKAHIEHSASDKATTHNVMMHKKWIAGFVIMVIVAVVDVYSFSLLDQSKQAAMGAVTLAWNTILAAWFLKESFTVLDAISVVIIMGGTILGLSFAAAESSDFNFDGILLLLKDDLVYGYTTCVLVALACITYYVETRSKIPRDLWTPRQAKLIAVLSPGLGGMCMGFTGYGAKAISTVIFKGEWSQFRSYAIYLYFLIAGVAVMMQVRYLNKGLEFFDALQVVPIFQSTIIFSNAMAGIVYYHDMRDAPAWKLSIFALGGGICVFGISLLLLKHPNNHGKQEGLAAVPTVDSGTWGADRDGVQLPAPTPVAGGVRNHSHASDDDGGDITPVANNINALNEVRAHARANSSGVAVVGSVSPIHSRQARTQQLMAGGLAGSSYNPAASQHAVISFNPLKSASVTAAAAVSGPVDATDIEADLLPPSVQRLVAGGLPTPGAVDDADSISVGASGAAAPGRPPAGHGHSMSAVALVQHTSSARVPWYQQEISVLLRSEWKKRRRYHT